MIEDSKPHKSVVVLENHKSVKADAMEFRRLIYFYLPSTKQTP